MSDKDILKDLFSEKLGNYEAQVRPELWSSISSKIATTATTSAVAGTSLLSKLIIGSSITAASILGGYFIYSSFDTKEDTKNNSSVNNSQIVSSKSESLKEETVKTQGLNQIRVSDQPNNPNPTPGNFILPTTSSNVDATHEVNNDLNEIIGTVKSVVPVESMVETNLENNNNTKITPAESKQVDTQTSAGTNSPTPDPEKSTVEEAINDANLQNVITLNNDGVDDVFSIQSKGLKDFSIVIMDARNNVIFRSNDPDFKWDGQNLKGETVEPGHYLYYLTAIDQNGKKVNKYKYLEVIK